MSRGVGLGPFGKGEGAIGLKISMRRASAVRTSGANRAGIQARGGGGGFEGRLRGRRPG